MTRHRTKLGRYAFFVLLGLCLAEAVMLPRDFGRYAQTFQQDGLIGFVSFPSVLAIQICILIGVLLLLITSFRREMGRGIRILSLALTAAVGIYGLSVFLIYKASLHGEFGIGVAGFAGLFGVIPSGVFLLLGVPFTFIYAIRNQTRTSIPATRAGLSGR